MAKRTFDLGAELRKAGGPTVGTREQIEYLDPDRIIPDPKNDYSMDGIEELAASIELVGLQQPLRVHDVEGGNYMLISGHRRREALMLLRNSGNEMFKHGFPCIRERPADIPEMQELKLIFGNAQTRVLSAPELSRQAVKTRDLISALRKKGFEFQGRTRELVASVLQTSDSRVGRLTAIRERLAPELLTQFDKGHIGETVAYRLSQETRELQSNIWRHCGISVQGLSAESVDFVIDQIKREQAPDNGRSGTPASAIGEPVGADPQISPQSPDTGGPMRASAPTEKTVNEDSAIDGLKKYLDARYDEDARFWKYMQEAADSLIQHSFAAGALPNRKDNIDMLRLDCRNCGVAGYAADWQGKNKGISIGPIEEPQIERTWTDTYDALAAIAITRWRAVLTEEKRRPKRKAEEIPPVFVPIICPEWCTGEPPRDGRYLARVNMGLDKPHEQTCEYKGGVWSCFGRPIDEVGKVVSWWPLPERW